MLSLELCRCSSDIFLSPADYVPDWQPRTLLGMVEARSVNVKNVITTTTGAAGIVVFSLVSFSSFYTFIQVAVFPIVLRYTLID